MRRRCCSKPSGRLVLQEAQGRHRSSKTICRYESEPVSAGWQIDKFDPTWLPILTTSAQANQPKPISPKEIEETAHNFMISSRTIGLDHNGATDAQVVESWVEKYPSDEDYKKAETERCLGDTKSAKIYANAYNKDPEFYSFTRSLNAYIQTFQGKNDVLVVEPDSEFFKYFKGDQ